MRKKERIIHKGQRGAALIVAMVVLLVMTMIGSSGMNQSVQSMRMSTGFRDYNYAYQFAETGLRLAEDILVNAENKESASTLLQAANISMKSEGDYTDPTYWNDVSIYSDHFPVKIIVQEWRSVSDSLQIGQNLSATVYYRITARGFDPAYQAYLEDGNSETNRMAQSQAVLQSIYAVRFGY